MRVHCRTFSLTQVECETNPARYWDWALDSKKPLSSPVWDSEIGFGGNDSSETGCIQGGPLNNILLNYTANGPSQHCLKRNFSDSPIFGEMHSNEWTPEIIENIITTSNTYPEFRERIENGPHKHLHDGIGGEMPGISSTNGISHFEILLIRK